MKHITLILCITCSTLMSCKKFLDEVPDKKLTIPSTVSDLQAILDHYNSMNNNYPVATEILADNYYMTTADFQSLTNEIHRNYYLWQANESSEAWVNIYTPVKNANVVLDNLSLINRAPGDQTAFDNVKGSALFYRGFYYLAGSGLFAQPYNSSTAAQDGGLALRLTSDFNQPTTRASVEQTYRQIITDLQQAMPLLPVTPLIKTRPSRPAVYGVLARVYLTMHQYDSAFKYADRCLALYGDSLMNFNTLSATVTAPVKRFNNEVIFHCRNLVSGTINPARAKIDSTLYNSYHANDLRKTIYYKSNGNGTYSFKADYDGSGTNTGYAFGGIVTDEMLLIRSEANARMGNITEAMQDLNKLLLTRWKTGTFIPFTAADKNDALTKILQERRKELFFRGTRWTDLRRLKDDPLFSVTPRRFIDRQIYQLLPANPRYTLRIPESVIAMTGMPQNP